MNAFVRPVLTDQEQEDLYPCRNCDSNHMHMRFEANAWRYVIECHGQPFCGVQVNGLPLQSFAGDYSQARQSAINFWQAINGREDE